MRIHNKILRSQGIGRSKTTSGRKSTDVMARLGDSRPIEEWRVESFTRNSNIQNPRCFGVQYATQSVGLGHSVVRGASVRET